MSKTVLDDLPLNEATKNRLRALARAGQKSDADLLAAAAKEYVADADYVARMIEEREAEADSGGPFASNEAVKKWLSTWGTEESREVPTPKIRT